MSSVYQTCYANKLIHMLVSYSSVPIAWTTRHRLRSCPIVAGSEPWLACCVTLRGRHTGRPVDPSNQAVWSHVICAGAKKNTLYSLRIMLITCTCNCCRSDGGVGRAVAFGAAMLWYRTLVLVNLINLPPSCSFRWACDWWEIADSHHIRRKGAINTSLQTTSS